MPADPDTLLFVRFRDHADVDALGQLYDQTAAELLRVAMHLVHDPARAEDLVQQTFVIAIEAAARFDAARRVRAWLLGILTNQARKLQRQEARQPEGLAEPTVDPLALVQTEEFTAQVDAAISTLPEVYQPVLVLHLKHGMIAAEIAHALRRPPGTVRTQLMRALDLLKKALPASLTLAACVLLTPVRGLAAVRDVVLATANRHVTTSIGTLSLVGGSLLMKKLVAAAALLALGVYAVIAFAPGTSAPAPRADEAEAPGAVRAVLPPPTPPAPPAVAAAPVDTVRELQIPPQYGSLRYRFLWAEDRTPAVGVFVHCMVWGRQNPFLHAIDVPTDHDGEIVLTALEPGRVGLYVDREEGDSPTILAGQESTGTYLIPRGVTVDVLVQDQRGWPIPNARVWLSAYGNDTQGQEVGATDAVGRLSVRDIAKGHDLAVRADGFAPSALWNLTGQPGERVDAVFVLSDGAATVRGLVCTADGRPCAAAKVCIDGFPSQPIKDRNLPASAPPPFDLRTDAMGQFVATGVPTGEVRLQARAAGSGTTTTTRTLRAGEVTQVELRLPAGATALGFVRDDAGVGLASATIGGGAGYGDFAYCSTTSAADGSFTLPDLTPEQPLELWAGLEPWLPNRCTVRLQAGEQRRLEFLLTRSQPSDQFRGRLTDEQGAPLVHWVVSIQPHDRSSTWSAWLHSDAAGRFVATGCPAGPYRLEVFDPGEQTYAYPTFVMPRVARDPDELRICVPSTALDFASLSGTVVADGHALAGASVALQRAGQPSFRSWTTDAEGHFVAERLPAGDYRLEVSAADHPILRLGERSLPAKQRLDLGRIVLPDGGRLAVRCHGLDGAPPSWRQATLSTTDGQEAGIIGLLSEPATSDLLAAGRYDLRVSGDGIAAQYHEVEILDRVTTTLDLPLERANALQCQVRWLPAAAWQSLDLTVHDAAGHLVWALRGLRRRGEQELLCACYLGRGDWQVAATTDTGLTGTVMVRVEGTATPAPVVIDLR